MPEKIQDVSLSCRTVSLWQGGGCSKSVGNGRVFVSRGEQDLLWGSFREEHSPLGGNSPICDISAVLFQRSCYAWGGQSPLLRENDPRLLPCFPKLLFLLGWVASSFLKPWCLWLWVGNQLKCQNAVWYWRALFLNLIWDSTSLLAMRSLCASVHDGGTGLGVGSTQALCVTQLVTRCVVQFLFHINIPWAGPGTVSVS